MSAFLIVLSFALGFAIGVFERKVDRIKVKNPLKRPEKEAEILITPDPEVVRAEEDRAFYAKIK